MADTHAWSLDALPPPLRGLHRDFLDLTRSTNQLVHTTLTLIRRIDDRGGYFELGCTSIVHYVELACGVSNVTARDRVRIALALGTLPAIDTALAEGRLSYSKVRAITRVATPENEGEWLDTALAETAHALDSIVARARRGQAPPERLLYEEAITAESTRMVVELPAEEMQLVQQALDGVRKQAGGTIAPAEALVLMAADCLAGNVGTVQSAERYTVVVHVDDEGGTVETETGRATLPRQTVERLLCDAAVRTSQRGEVGRRTRTIPTSTRRAIELRHRGRCAVPACKNRLWLEAHHRVPWHRGGDHTMENLVLLCTRHHQLVHDGKLRVDSDGFQARGWRLNGTAWDACAEAMAATA